MALKWQDPPSKASARTDNDSTAAELRRNPGRWAIVHEYDTHSTAACRADAIKKGRIVAYRPAGVFESCTRQAVEKGKKVVRVYARYVGE